MFPDLFMGVKKTAGKWMEDLANVHAQHVNISPHRHTRGQTSARPHSQTAARLVPFLLSLQERIAGSGSYLSDCQPSEIKFPPKTP